MRTIKNYIIANNVKNPFQMRATSPLKTNYAELLRSDVSGDKIKAGKITGSTSVVAVEPVSNKTETGVNSFGKALPGLDDTDKDATEKKQFNDGLRKRIDKAPNVAKEAKLSTKLYKKEKRQNKRADKIYKKNPDVFDRRKQGGLDQIASSASEADNMDFSVSADDIMNEANLTSQNKMVADMTPQINKSDIGAKVKSNIASSIKDRGAVTGSKKSDEITNVMKDDINKSLTQNHELYKMKSNYPASESNKKANKKQMAQINMANIHHAMRQPGSNKNTSHDPNSYINRAFLGFLPNLDKMAGKTNPRKNYVTPLNYNPFSPRQQDIVGQVYNPSGNDISQFQDGQAFNKSASNPNTYNQPAIPTEADTTMNDLQTGNAPMGAFGDDLSGAMMSPTGLAPEQGMGSTQFGGVTPNLTRKEIRRQRRQENRQYRRTGIRPFGG